MYCSASGKGVAFKMVPSGATWSTEKRSGAKNYLTLTIKYETEYIRAGGRGHSRLKEDHSFLHQRTSVTKTSDAQNIEFPIRCSVNRDRIF
jgi:hypothetical protein